MTALSARRERFFKTLVILFSVVLFVSGSLLLFLFDIVHFEWSRKLEENLVYRENKSKENRILVLGDSQLAEEIAERSLHKQLKAFCSENDVGFASGAHPGYGPLEYLRQLERYATDYQPDLILLFYNVHNDLTDVLYRMDEEPTEETIPLNIYSKTSERKHTAAVSEEKKAVITDHSTFINQAPGNPEQFDWERFERAGIDPALIRYGKNRLAERNSIHNDTLINPHLLVTAVWQPEYLFFNLSLKGPESKYAWYRTLKLFDRMMEISERLGSRFALVAIPSTLQVDNSHYTFFNRLKMPTDSAWLKSSLPQELLDTFSRVSNTRLIDLLPEFRRSTRQDLYYANDDHLNDNGHDLAFEIIQQKLLVPYLNKQMGTDGKVRKTDLYKAYNAWKRDYVAFMIEQRLDLGD